MGNKIIDADDMSSNITGPTVYVGRNGEVSSLQLVYTGTPTGTFSWEGSNSVDPQTGTVQTWSSFTLDKPAANPAGSAGDELIDLVDLPWQAVRLKYTASSGSGNLTVYDNRRT